MIFQMLVDLTFALGRLASRPFRFLFSRRYREETRQRWRLHPVRAWFEFIGGSVVVLLLVAMISFWTFAFGVGAREATPSEEKRIKELKERIIEEIRHPKKKT
jgi:H+/gluconate symporter-like permease